MTTFVLVVAAALIVSASCAGTPRGVETVRTSSPAAPATASAQLAATVRVAASPKPTSVTSPKASPTSGARASTSPASPQSECVNGVVVPDPNSNPGLVQDCVVLLGIQRSLAGTAELNWTMNHEISWWQGVRLSDLTPRRVVELSLTSRWLTGWLPPEISGLVELRTLDLTGNRLLFSIPPETGLACKPGSTSTSI